jgi:hypothetical protein
MKLKEAQRDEGDNPELRRFQVVLAPPEVAPVAFTDVDRSDELKWNREPREGVPWRMGRGSWKRARCARSIVEGASCGASKTA